MTGAKTGCCTIDPFHMKTTRYHTMIKRNLILLTLVAVLGTACKRDEPASPLTEPAADAAPAPVAEANPIDAIAVVENTPASDAVASGIDSKALAGKFSDGESVLELKADGSYVQTLQAGGSTVSTDGSWSTSGTDSLLLDPNSKSAEDAAFVVVSNDELSTDNGARSFRRVTTQ